MHWFLKRQLSVMENTLNLVIYLLYKSVQKKLAQARADSDYHTINFGLFVLLCYKNVQLIGNVLKFSFRKYFRCISLKSGTYGGREVQNSFERKKSLSSAKSLSSTKKISSSCLSN